MKEEIVVKRFHSLFTAPIQKAVFAFLLAIFAPIAPALIILFVLIAIDTVCGIVLAVKNSNLSSARLRRVAGKCLLYITAVLVVRLAEQQLLHTVGRDIDYLANFLILYFSLTEVISVLETLAKLGIAVPSPVLMFFKKQIDTNKLPGK